MIITLAPGPIPPSTRGNVFLPIVATPPIDPVAELVRLLTSDARQQHPVLTY